MPKSKNTVAQFEKVNFIPSVARLITGTAYVRHGLNDRNFDDVKYIQTRVVRAMEDQIFGVGEYGDDFVNHGASVLENGDDIRRKRWLEAA